MASTYSTNLALELITTGEQAGSWGINTNNNLGTLIEQAVSGYVTQAITDGADTVITIPNGATGVARNMTIECTGALTAARNLIVPANKKLYFIYNNTTGGYAVTVKVSGQTGVSVPNGKKMLLVSNGTDVVEAITYSSTIVPANPTASVGLTAVNGTASAYMRSDAAPALNQTISPTWTGTHTFNGTLAGTAFASPPALGGTAPNSASFTSLSASGTVSGVGFQNYMASPPAIGGTAPNTGAFTTLSATSTVSGTGFTNLFASPPVIGSSTPNSATFTSVAVTGTFSAAALVPTGSSVPTNGFYYPATNTLGAATNSTNRMTIGTGIQVGSPTGGDMGAGTLNATALYINGVGVSSTGNVPANPTATIGLTAVNGTAVTFIRSDGAPALDQSIAPTWTGVHTFANSIALGTPTNQGTAGQVLMSAGTGATPTWGTPVAGFTIDEAYFFAGF